MIRGDPMRDVLALIARNPGLFLAIYLPLAIIVVGLLETPH